MPKLPAIALVDYGMGNLRSVAKALEKVGAAVTILQQDPGRAELKRYDGLVLPGVGALGDCIVGLRRSGLDRVVRDWVEADRYFFGICLGFQALFGHSEEGNVDGLGLFPGEVKRFRLGECLKVPHMGWNAVSFRGETGAVMQEGLQDGDQFYYVHSYHVVPADEELIWCVSDYGGEFVGGVARGRIFATQFHPEKSQSKGLRLYRNFVNLLG